MYYTKPLVFDSSYLDNTHVAIAGEITRLQRLTHIPQWNRRLMRFQHLLQIVINAKQTLGANPANKLEHLAMLQYEWKHACQLLKYDDTLTEREFTPANLNTLIREVTNQNALVARNIRDIVAAQAQHPSSYKARKQTALQNYSIIVIKDETGTRYWLLSKLCVAAVTNRGIVKVAFPITTASGKISIHFDEPYGCKVHYDALPGATTFEEFSELSHLLYEDFHFMERDDKDQILHKRYSLMRLYPGYSLNKFLANYEQLSFPHKPSKVCRSLNFHQRLTICLRIAEDLQRIHVANLLNLDLKTANIIINPQHNLDFEVHIIDADDAIKVSHEKKLLQPQGTPCYRPPEMDQVQPGSPLIAHFSANIYSLGAVFIEVIMGEMNSIKMPYDRLNYTTFRDWIESIQHLFNANLKAISTQIKQLLKDMMQPEDPHDRLPLMTVIDRLQPLIANLMQDLSATECLPKDVPRGNVLTIVLPPVSTAASATAHYPIEEARPLLGKAADEKGCCILL